MIIKELNYHNRTITQNEGDKNKLTNLLNFNYVTVFFPFQVALILLALAAVVSADSYGKSSYGHGYKTDYAVRFYSLNSEYIERVDSTIC